LLLLLIRDGSTWGCSPLLAEPLPRKVENMDRLHIERVGGLAGFGGPHLKSRGELELSDLSPADKQAVEGLFKDPQKGCHRIPAKQTRFAIASRARQPLARKRSKSRKMPSRRR
jgi:hypothetical protein